MAFIGGTGSMDDDSLKITAESHSPMATFGSLKIDFPYKDQIQSISLDFCAGDVAYLTVSYYYVDSENKVKIWSEQFTIKDLKLSLQSAKRIFHADGIHLEDGTRLDEEFRNKVLGIMPT